MSFVNFGWVKRLIIIIITLKYVGDHHFKISKYILMAENLWERYVDCGIFHVPLLLMFFYF